MIHLDLADVLVIAERVLGGQPDSMLETGDLDSVRAVLEQARRCDEPTRAAATLLHGLALRQPFGHRSDEVALVAALQLMALNGREVVDLGPPERARSLLGLACNGAVSVDDLCAWLAEGTGSTGLLEAEAKERATAAAVRASLLRRVRELRSGRRKDKDEGSEEAMFERFTTRARQVIVHAQEEARLLKHHHIGTEHVLLGLVHEGEGVAAKALESLGISLEAVRAQVEKLIGQGQSAPTGHIPFTPRAKKVLELSLREAVKLKHHYIGTEHILLGLIREGEGVAAQVLVNLGADLSRVREQVVQLLGSGDLAGLVAVDDEEARQRERGLLAGIAELGDENRRLRAEVERLKGLLRQHSIEPEGGESKTA
jgi:hypothetical protein